jgi:DNA-binding NtrC family response regulator
MNMAPASPLLIVEDEESVLRIFVTWLRDEGHEVVAFARFGDARHYLTTEVPSGLVTDIRLGAFNGLQLAMQLSDRKPDAPIVVVSAFDDPTLRKEAERLGAVFVLKPIRREMFLAALRDASARRRQV